MRISELIDAIYPEGAEYSTHQLDDDNNRERIEREGKMHVVYDSRIIEWLDTKPMPTYEQLSAKEAELEGAA